jgi:hypothetical protein
LGIVGLALVLELSVPMRDSRYGHKLRTYDHWMTLGKFLARDSGQVLAVDAAGKIPFFSDLTTIDMLGLNDHFIAHEPARPGTFRVGHNKFDPEYVLSRHPDLIATWFDNEQLDLRFGLSRAKYERAGYRLRYVLNVNPTPFPENIVDVTHKSDEQIVSLMRAGYTYVVADRRPGS